mgnify:CR=1 FL=1
MFNAMTMGVPISINCSERNRFLSMLVASTILMIAFGFSFRTKFRLTSSSLE